MPVLEFTRSGSVAVLTMNRPAARNALDTELREALAETLPSVRDDAGVRAVVLTGAGGHFCAGGDVRGMSAAAQGDGFDARQRTSGNHRWFESLVDLEKPVIAAVEGAAFGAGLSLALAADFVLADPNARFCCAFARMGYVPDLGSMYLLPRAVGLSRAKELAFSARELDAQEAHSYGLVHRITDPGAVLSEAVALASRFEHAPAGAIGLMKSVMNRAFESDRHTVLAQEAMALVLCRESGFFKESAQRFLDKQPPLFQWPDRPGHARKTR